MKNILCIPKKNFLELKNKNIESVTKLIAQKSLWMERDLAEKDENFLQIIPYLVVEKQNDFGREDPEFFMYKRLNKGNEKRLHANYSLGVGGHIDEQKDGVLLYNGISAEEVVFLAAREELTEEIENNSKVQSFHNLKASDIYWLDIIYDDSNEVGRVHLGLVGLVSLYGEKSLEVTVKEKDKLEGKLCSLKEIQAKYDQLESWSKKTWNILKSLGN